MMELEWVAMPSSKESSPTGIELASLMSPTLQADSLPTDPPGKASILVWRIPWTKEPEKLQSRGFSLIKAVSHDQC